MVVIGEGSWSFQKWKNKKFAHLEPVCVWFSFKINGLVKDILSNLYNFLCTILARLLSKVNIHMT